MTITDTPTHRAELDEAQVLFEEARQRRKRRWLVSGIAALIIVVMAFGVTVGLLASQGNGSSPRPVGPATPALGAVATKVSFSIRPALCYAPPYAVPGGQAPSTGPLPACSQSTMLTAANLQVTPSGGNVNGYTSNSNVNTDPQFATYPSTIASNAKQGQEVLVPTASADGSARYVLGPVGLGRSAIAHAHATHIDGQWAIYLALTPRGAMQWDSLAAQQFHAIIGVVINGQVVSAPIMQPTQSSFTSFDGQLQISGGFTEHQAKTLASAL